MCKINNDFPEIMTSAQVPSCCLAGTGLPRERAGATSSKASRSRSLITPNASRSVGPHLVNEQ